MSAPNRGGISIDSELARARETELALEQKDFPKLITLAVLHMAQCSEAAIFEVSQLRHCIMLIVW